MKKLVKELYSAADFDAMTRNLKESILIAEAKGTALSKKHVAAVAGSGR